jgi:hypothetical protein
MKINGYKFRTELAKICPDYQIDEDLDGQIVIYTNLKEIENDTYVPFELEEEEEEE